MKQNRLVENRSRRSSALDAPWVRCCAQSVMVVAILLAQMANANADLVTLTFSNLPMTGATDTYMDIGGNQLSPQQYDRIVITNSIHFDGTLHVALTDSNGLKIGSIYQPVLGDVFQLFGLPTPTSMPSNITGSFASYDFPSLTSGLQWDTSDLYTLGNLRISAIPECSQWIGFGLLSLLAGLRAAWRRIRG